jgi:hypothetical protein
MSLCCGCLCVCATIPAMCDVPLAYTHDIIQMQVLVHVPVSRFRFIFGFFVWFWFWFWFRVSRSTCKFTKHKAHFPFAIASLCLVCRCVCSFWHVACATPDTCTMKAAKQATFDNSHLNTQYYAPRCNCAHTHTDTARAPAYIENPQAAHTT